LVEHNPSKVRVAGPNPVSRAYKKMRVILQHAGPRFIPADVAQLVERFLGKEEVTGSIPVIGSKKIYG
jgi:hypothetical protein